MEEALRYLPLLIVLAIGGGIYLYGRRRPAPGPTQSDEPSGIGGWLIVPAFAVVIMPLVSLTAGVAYLRYISSNPDSHVAFGIVGATTNIAFAVSGVVLAVMFFQYRKTVPKLFFALSLAALILVLASLFFVAPSDLAADETSPMLFVGVPGFGLLWAVYMLVSVRVRNTFTR